MDASLNGLSANERNLARHERAVLAKILAAFDLPGMAALISQIHRIRVVEGLPTFLHFKVDQPSAPAPFPDGVVPVRTFVEDESGRMLGQIFVWVEGGYLSAMEYPWVSDSAPSEFPSPERVRIAGLLGK